MSLCLQVRLLLFIYSLIVSKFTTYYSNVVAPPRPGSFCGVRIRSMFFVTAPLDFGLNFNFLSYDGSLTLCCAGDVDSVAEPQRVVDFVHGRHGVGFEAKPPPPCCMYSCEAKTQKSQLGRAFCVVAEALLGQLSEMPLSCTRA